mgnify:CR=1 FL=1
MTKEELLKCENNTPVLLADGKFGVLIRWGQEAGVQVSGEEDIRWIPVERLADKGGGALIERTEAK